MSGDSLYEDPALYDLLFPSASDADGLQDEVRRERLLASERFYLEESRRSGGRVLEMACGSGRLTIPIAKNGIDILGVDLSASMLEAAQTKAQAAGVQVQFIQADMRQVNVPGPFAAILIPGNSLLHLHSIDDLKQCLAGVRRLLGAGGRLVFDISKWELQHLVRDPAQRYPVLALTDPQRGQVTIEETASYDSAAQVRHIVWHLSAPGAPDFKMIEYRLRVIFPQELPLLLEAAGFRMLERYGEFTRVQFDSSSPRQVCVCSASV
ncbi:MAG TPA: methyltransferase domain-containing protein [Bryobacteraceae bacterium]|nr:methyltransferase domain-containing protein [Bryobacteraceae bacterium]